MHNYETTNLPIYGFKSYFTLTEMIYIKDFIEKILKRQILSKVFIIIELTKTIPERDKNKLINRIDSKLKEIKSACQIGYMMEIRYTKHVVNYKHINN